MFKNSQENLMVIDYKKPLVALTPVKIHSQNKKPSEQKSMIEKKLEEQKSQQSVQVFSSCDKMPEKNPAMTSKEVEEQIDQIISKFEENVEQASKRSLHLRIQSQPSDPSEKPKSPAIPKLNLSLTPTSSQNKSMVSQEKDSKIRHFRNKSLINPPPKSPHLEH